MPLEEQRHESIAFFGSDFKNSELNWTTFETEALAIFQTFKRVEFLRVFTDHCNVLFVFAPLALEPSSGRHIVSKVQRWASLLSLFDYIIEHVSGEENVFADILTRWARSYRREEHRRAICSLLMDSAKQIVPSANDVNLPNIEVL